MNNAGKKGPCLVEDGGSGIHEKQAGQCSNCV